jgi:hypothetical protein
MAFSIVDKEFMLDPPSWEEKNTTEGEWLHNYSQKRARREKSVFLGKKRNRNDILSY